LSGPKKIKRPNLAISSFKKGQRKAKFPSKICKKLNKNLEFQKMFEICSDLSKTGIKNILFLSTFQNGQMAKPFYFWQKTVSKRPNCNPVSS